MEAKLIMRNFKRAASLLVAIFMLAGFMVFPAFGVTAVVTISGTPQVGQTLTLNTVTALDGPTTYEWYTATDSSGTGRATISGATGKTYTIVADDLGKFIGGRITDDGDGSNRVYTTTAVVAAPVVGPGTGGGTDPTPAAPAEPVIVPIDESVDATNYASTDIVLAAAGTEKAGDTADKMPALATKLAAVKAAVELDIAQEAKDVLFFDKDVFDVKGYNFGKKWVPYNATQFAKDLLAAEKKGFDLQLTDNLVGSGSKAAPFAGVSYVAEVKDAEGKITTRDS